MTWGNYGHRVEEGLPDGVRARLAMRAGPTSATPAVVRRPGPPHVRAILDLQRAAGNRAVVQMLRGDVPVQRQDEEYEAAGAGWSTNEEAPAASYSADDYSSGETYGPPPPPEWSGGGGELGGDAGQGWASAEAAPAQEPAGGGGGGGSEWSSGGGSGAGGGEASGGGGEPAPADEGSSWWPFGGGGQETPRNAPGESAPGGDEGGGSSWWPFGGGGEETPAGDEGGSSWWPFGGGGDEAPSGDDGGGSWWPFGGDDEAPGDEEAGEHSQDEMDAKEAEGEIGVKSDVYVTTSGSPVHGVSGASGAEFGQFHDGGRRGTVPFRDEMLVDHHDGMPHAITTGGKTGTRAWAGGGGAGPKGNQKTGTFSKQVVPDYDTYWGGIRTNASAWVIPGTGIFDVHRDYMSSDPGDQGNGWWISQNAAAALEAHEQRHLDMAKQVYGSNIQPMLDRIANSKKYGHEINYRSSVSQALVEKYVNWKPSIDKWSSEDALWNADNGQVDTEDLMSPRYPVPMKTPRTIEGKDYEKWLVMPGEKPPP